MKNGEEKRSLHKGIRVLTLEDPLSVGYPLPAFQEYLLGLMGGLALPPANPLNARLQRKGKRKLNLQIIDQGQKPYRLPIPKGRCMGHKRWKGNRRASGAGGRGGNNPVILC